MQIRHGDVLLVGTTMPKGTKVSAKGRVVLAEGEVTGHAHVITGRVELRSLAEEQYLAVKEVEAILTHQEHGDIKVPQGTYRIVHQREYSPEEIRRVQD